MYAGQSILDRWFSPGSFRRDATVLFTSTAAGRAILVLAIPILARYFRPEDIGSWQLFMSSVTVLATIACWRYEVAIPLPSEDKRARDLMAACLVLSVVTSALLAIPMLLCRSAFVALVGAPEIGPFVWFIPAITMLAGWEQAATFWLTRGGNFSGVAGARVCKSLCMAILPLVTAFTIGAGVGGLILGTILGQLAASLYLLTADRSLTAAWKQSTGFGKRGVATMFEYRNYPLYVAPYAFLGQFGKRLVFFLLASFAGATTVGCFVLAMQLTYVPATFIAAALNQAFYRQVSGRQAVHQLEPLVLRVLELQLRLAIPIFFLIVLYGNAGTRLLLGPAWSEAADYVPWLSAMSLMLFFTAWLDRLYDKLGRQRLATVLQVFYDATSLALLWGLLASGATTTVAVAAYAISAIIYNAIWLAVAFRISGFSFARLGRLGLIGIGGLGSLLAAHLAFSLVADPAAMPFIDTILACALAVLGARQSGGFAV